MLKPHFEQKQFSLLTRSMVSKDKFNRFTIRSLFSKLGRPNVVLITSNASNVPKIPGVTPITGKGLSEGSNEFG